MALFLLLRFEAPLLSFGANVIDAYGVIQAFPTLSMLTGLLGNALGYEHAQADLLENLQRRLHYAVRCDQQGSLLTDYQTVDLGQDFLVDTGWTTSNIREEREGSPDNAKGTHIRYRDYWADSIYTVALTLHDPKTAPTLGDLAWALQTPARPLFLGRKCCLPAAPIFLALSEAASLLDALQRATPPKRILPKASFEAWWPDLEVSAEVDKQPTDTKTELIPVIDRKDWRNQVIVGRRMIRHGFLPYLGGPHES
jgi:CRISPR system Cascade subunit CasD